MPLTREEGLALSGENNDKEAQGLDLIKALVAEDGRIRLEKTTEGCWADFCVFAPGCEEEAIGVQLKTSHVAKGANCCQFAHTSGYTGLLLVLVGFIGGVPRAWMLPGSEREGPGNTLVPIASRRESSWPRREVKLSSLVQGFIDVMAAPSDCIFKPVAAWMIPTSPNHQKEHEAMQLLRERLPLEFIAPHVEHRAWDWEVDGSRLQMKLAYWDEQNSSFGVCLKKMGGRKGGKQTWTQYTLGDFDYLVIQLPEVEVLRSIPPRVYMLPFNVLKERGAVCKQVASGEVRVFPHRKAHVKTDWVEAFAIDLSTPATAVEGYERIREGVAYVDTNDCPPGISQRIQDGQPVGYTAQFRGRSRVIISRHLSMEQKLRMCEEWLAARRAGIEMPKGVRTRSPGNEDLPSGVYRWPNGKLEVNIRKHPRKTVNTLAEALKLRAFYLREDEIDAEVAEVLEDVLEGVVSAFA